MAIGSRKLEKISKFFCAQLMEKRPTDLKAMFLHKVLSKSDTLHPLVVFNPLENFFEYNAVLFAELQFCLCKRKRNASPAG
jgi:hypothetical protein